MEGPTQNLWAPDALLTAAEDTGAQYLSWVFCTFWDEEGFRPLVEEMHARSVRVVVAMSNYDLWTRGSIQSVRPSEVAAAAQVDPWGNEVRRSDWWSPGGTSESHNLLHPAWQNFWLETLKSCVDAGVDGILIDEGLNIFNLGVDFSPYLMDGFRDYLLANYSSAELAALGAEHGVSDFTTFDYAEFFRSQFPDRTSLTDDEWSYNSFTKPLHEEFRRFWNLQLLDVLVGLITDVKSYALSEYGREIPIGSNVLGFNENHWPIVPHLDFMEYEAPYACVAAQWTCGWAGLSGFPPAARLSHWLKMADFTGIPVQGVHTAANYQEVTKEKSTDFLVRYMKTVAADVISGGGSYYVGDLQYEIPYVEVLPYYRFPIESPELFTGTTADPGRIAVLWLHENWETAPLGGISYLLADSGFQYSVVYGGGDPNSPDPLMPYPLHLDSLKSFPVVILSRGCRVWHCVYDDEVQPLWWGSLTEHHASVLLEYVENGGTLLIPVDPQEITVAGREAIPGEARDLLLSLLDEPTATYGQGTVAWAPELSAIDYLTSPTNEQRATALVRLARFELSPEVSVHSNTAPVSVLIRHHPEGRRIHVINYGHVTAAPGPAVTSGLELSVQLQDGELTGTAATWHTPIEPKGVELATSINNGVLFVDLPPFEIWGVLSIGN
jgi:hypothetical protein|tara:strand:+ start:152 stop:2149 length:1998 start_codon:yes stop_codon:yes gene_type:complete